MSTNLHTPERQAHESQRQFRERQAAIDNPRAFPGEMAERFGQPTDCNEGMTLLDYFAAHAPQMPPALNEIAKLQEKRDGRDTSDYGAYAKVLADWRWAYAEAMLKARS